MSSLIRDDNATIPLDSIAVADPRLDGLYLPRTRSYALLRVAGLPLLRGCLLLENSASAIQTAKESLKEFQAVLVRSDPMHKTSPTLRGGDIWAISDLERCCEHYFAADRAVLLFEPYERTQNRWSFSLQHLPSGEFELEVVGPGFDCGHLNRGRVVPHERFTGELIANRRPRVTIHEPFDASRHAADCEKLGIQPPSVPGPLPDSMIPEILAHFQAVKLLAPKGPFVLTGAVLEPNSRLAYWDLFDPGQALR